MKSPNPFIPNSYIGPLPASSVLLFPFHRNEMFFKNCPLLVLILGPLASEASALTNELQPLAFISFLSGSFKV